jgi:KDO2-lipid IV(A) lauroyltransferase
MAKARSPLLDYAVYIAFRIGVCILQGMPTGLACLLADGIISIVFHFNRRHREVAIDNLRCAFPGRYTEAKLNALALQVYRHFAATILEVILMPRKVTAKNMRRKIDIREYTRIKQAIDSGRPVIVLTAHYGNWELAAHCLALAGVRSHLVARPFDNPYLDGWLRAVRESTGHKVLSKTGDIRRMTEVLYAGETLCTLGDQDAGRRGIFVSFFGRPASTHKAIARLAKRTGALITIAGIQRTGGLFRHTLRIMDVIDPEEYDGDPDATLSITQRFTTAVENLIRLDPAQYFWLHRRWKHQPVAGSASDRNPRSLAA